MDFVEACRKIIGIDSTPQHGSRAMAEFVRDYCAARGMKTEIQSEIFDGREEENIIIRTGAERSEQEFLLQAHLDTVDPGPYQRWTKTNLNPFDGTIIDGQIYGLGAADVKLDLLCKMEAICSFSQIKSWKLPPVLVGTFGEELGMPGAIKLIRRNKINAKMALIGDPTNMHLINAGKGYARVEVRIPFSDEEKKSRAIHNSRESTSTQSKLFNGNSGHSASINQGDSAIEKLMEHLVKLPQDLTLMEIDGGTNFNSIPSVAVLEIDLVTLNSKTVLAKIVEIYGAIKKLEKDFLNYHDSDFSPSHPTLSIGMIRTMEDEVIISGICRMPPIITHSIYESWMRFLADACESNGGSMKVLDYKKPYRVHANSMLVKGCLDILRSLGKSDQCLTQPSTSEASIFSRIGVECVCFGPGQRAGNIHTPFENVSIEDLTTTIEFYKKVIERFCL